MTDAAEKDARNQDAAVLVTGLPRCGSSWVGQALSRAPGVRYRYESLNADWVPALKGALAHFRYQSPGAPAPDRVARAADRALAGDQSLRQSLRALYRGYAPAALRRRGRLVLKDPTACLLAAWLEATHGCRVVVLYRHPCGFASSIQALEWPIRLRRLLTQEDLVKDHLEPWLPQLELCIADPWASLGAFWAAVHHVLRRQAGEDWLFLSYEALCLTPAEAFGALSRHLDLAVAPPARDGAHRGDPGSTVKDSRRMATIWRERLSPAAVDAVMEPVEAFGLRDWGEAALVQASA